MGYPDQNQSQFILDTDACDTGIGAVLSQLQDGREKVLAYGSRTLNKRNYCVTDKELLAVRYFTEYFKQYLLGQKFIVRTDHQALVWLYKLKEPKGRIARWIEILSAYNFEIEYRPGPRHGNADGLSRCPNPADCMCSEGDNLENFKCGPCNKCRKRTGTLEKTQDVRNVTTRKHEKPELLPEGTAWMSKRSSASLQYLQMEDEHVGPIVKWKSEGRKPTKEEVVKYSLTTRHYVCLWEQIKLIDGVLYKNCSTTLGQNLTQLQVPEKLKPEILQLCHCSLLSGHLGLKKTKFRITKQFYWYEIRDSIKIFIQSCDTCASNKKTNRTPKAKLGSYPVGVPWERLGVDFLGPLPVTKQGNRYIMVCIDYFSKWAEAVAVPDQTARTTAKVLLEMVSRFGCPVTLHSDQGRNFESNLISELCIFLQIKKTRSTPRNPKGNGLVERFNRTLIQMVRAYIISDDE